jgi:hypothetical protein
LLGCTFHHPAADRISFGSHFQIIHALTVLVEVPSFLAQHFSFLSWQRRLMFQYFYQLVDMALIEFGFPASIPALGSRDFAARQLRPEHISGWAYTLSCGELARLAGSTDERQAGQSEARVCRTVMAAALELYLRWWGQVTETVQPLELPEPDELPIPAGVIE